MKSIQTYLRTRIVLGAAVILAAGSLAMALAIRRLDINELDEKLLEKAHGIAALMMCDGDSLEVAFTAESMPEFENAESGEFFQFRTPDGKLIERSPSLGNHDMPLLPINRNDRGEIFKDYYFPDGRHGRMVQVLLNPCQAGSCPVVNGHHTKINHPVDPDQPFVVLGLAHCRDGLDRLLTRVYTALASVDLLLLLLISAVVQHALKKGFRPITDLNAQINKLRPGNLDQRINLPSAPQELQPVLAALNEFVEKLQVAFERESSFTSDVAHELRTPIAEFRVACDVGLRWVDDAELVRKRLEELHKSAMNMEYTVNTLLELSRLDRGTVVLSKEDVNLQSIIDKCINFTTEDAEKSDISIENRVDPDITVVTDPGKLEIMLKNIIGNAVSHGTDGAPVVCEARSSDETCKLTISNHTSNLTPADLSYLFQRFWRKDVSRTGDRHSGLGLSIVQAIADAMDIAVEANLDGNLFIISISFQS